MASDALDGAIDESHVALEAIVNGDSQPFADLFSERDDVTLGNPFGPFARGRSQVVETLAGAASHYEDGAVLAFEPIARHATDTLACVVEVERYQAKVGGRDDLAIIGLRVTSVFRREAGGWRLVHRHADPITTPQPPESILTT